MSDLGGQNRLLVSVNTASHVWTDDRGDKWVAHKESDSRYADGVWVVFHRGNSFEMVVDSVHDEELRARRQAMLNLDARADVVFVPWDEAITDPMDAPERRSKDSSDAS